MTVQGVYAQDVEQWRRELRAAGWLEESSTVWESPSGLRYRGPFKAWCVMKGVPCELPSQSDAAGDGK